MTKEIVILLGRRDFPTDGVADNCDNLAKNGQNQITKSLNNYLQKYYILDKSFPLGNNKDAMIDVYQIKSANLVLLP